MYEELRKKPSAVWTGPVPEDWPLDVQIEDERGIDLMQLRDYLALTPTERIRRHYLFRTSLERIWEQNGVKPNFDF